MTQQQHSAVVGGSTAARIIACPGSRRLSERAPPRKESEYAATGTALHEVMAGKPPTQSFSEEEVNLLLQAGDAIKRDVVPDFIAQELTVQLHPIVGAFGQIDLVRLYGRRLEVIDWKFGQGVQVFPEQNPQLMFYAAALVYSMPDIIAGVDEIALAIVQPNDRGLPVWREWTVDVLDLFHFVRKLKRAVAQGDDDPTPFATGAHCRWCPANAICPVLKAKAENAITQDPRHMTPEQLAEALTLADSLDGWVNQLYEYAHERMSVGVPVPGRKLVEKRAMRRWRDNDDVLVELIKRTGVPVTELYDDPVLKSPAQLEKKFKIKADDLTEARSSGTVVVPTTDKRPAFVPSGAFKAFAEQVDAMNKRVR